MLLLPALYILAEGAALVLLKILEARGQAPGLCTGLMYGAVVLNTLFLCGILIRRAVSPVKSTGPRRYRVFFTAAGLFATLAADTFLVLLDDYYLAGVLLFCAVQTFYGIALRPALPTGILRIVSFAAVCGILLFLGAADPLSIAAGYSITQLLLNAVLSWVRFGKTEKDGDFKTAPLFSALGLTLFLGCDLCVGLFNLSCGIRSLQLLCTVSGFLIWVFYLPSQVLIVLSVYTDRCSGEEKSSVQPSGDKAEERMDS